jgi:hypothetical protein
MGHGAAVCAGNCITAAGAASLANGLVRMTQLAALSLTSAWTRPYPPSVPWRGSGCGAGFPTAADMMVAKDAALSLSWLGPRVRGL